MAFTIWLTGMSASGKTTIAKALKERFPNCVWLDGDNFRKYVSNDLAFSIYDRRENLRRAVGMAKLLNEQEISVIASFITPLESVRMQIKEELNSIIVHLHCSLKGRTARDQKGLYERAAEKRNNFWFALHYFEEPSNPDVTIDTELTGVEEAVKRIIIALNRKNLISAL